MNDNLKIGIISYHRAINYGAVLQAYALNKCINSMGYTCDTLDYHCDAVEIQYQLRNRRSCFSWKNYVAHNLTCLLHAKKKSRMEEFRNSFRLSAPCNRGNIQSVASAYDILITGSDQVFNPICHRNDPSYFLDFAGSARKCAYAASLGSIASFEKSTLDTDALLKTFKFLSFREAEAAEYMSRRLGRECEAVVDPVWLLSIEAWSKIAEAPKQKDYIFVYNLMNYPYMRSFVRRLQKKTGLNVISVNGTILGDAMYAGFSLNRSNCSPNAFLGLIRDADYVVTDSFHGTCFSMIFEKEFFSAANPKADNTNSRLHAILKTGGTENRLIVSDDSPALDRKIDYDAVKKRTALSVNNSIEYLKQHLQLM